MEKYKVGQLSKVMGVTSHTLKHYEKFNLIAPVKDQENNYRYYDIRQCNRILESRKYRNIGFSLKDVSEIMNQSDNNELMEKLVEHKRKLETEIEQLNKQLKYTMEFYQESKEIDEKLGEWFIETCPPMFFYKQTNNSQVITETPDNDSAAMLMQEMPETKPTLYFSGKSFQESKLEFHWGIAKIDPLEKIGENENLKYVEKQKTFVTYLRVKTPFLYENSELITKIKEQYYEFRYAPILEAYLMQYKILQEENGEYHYFKVVIPIKS